LIGFLFGLVSDQFLIDSGVASARTKLPRFEAGRNLEPHGVGSEYPAG
jgi:hypothetical protein